MASKCILGIDPGKHGGMCVLSLNGDILELHKMPATPSELNELIFHLISEYYPLQCYIERVSGMPGQGGAAMFNFGYNYGMLIQCLTDEMVPHTEVLPAKWQSAMGCRGKTGESKTAHKNRIKDIAKRKFPKEKITLATADAVMIACYGFTQQ